MSFKKEIMKDIDRNFFKEFGENINFSGIKLKGLLSFSKFENKYSQKHPLDDGLIKKGVTLTIREGDLPKMVGINEKVSINGQMYVVKAIKRELKLLEIDLQVEVDDVFN